MKSHRSKHGASSRGSWMAKGGLSVAAVFAAATAQGQLTHVIVFGDSLSDTGGSYALTMAINQVSLGAFDVRPGPPGYAVGKWTNGFSVNYGAYDLSNSMFDGIWHWTMANLLTLTKAHSWYGTGPNYNNFAIGGATCGPGIPTSFGLPRTVNIGHQFNELYLPSNPAPDPNALYVFFGGGNDIRDAVLDGTASNGTSAAQVGETAALYVAGYIWELARRARVAHVSIKVAWPNVVPMEAIPDFADLYGGNAVWRINANIATLAFRNTWAQQIQAIQYAYPNHIRIYPVDFWQYLMNARAGRIPGYVGMDFEHPVLAFSAFSGLGFNPVRNSTANVPSGANPDLYVFWDQVHPTARVHELMGSFAAQSCDPLSWQEIGDAGDNPGEAQPVTGSGVFTSIRGQLEPDDVDMYRIAVCGGAAFNATTVGGTSLDTQLFLFRLDGRGVTFNDDSTGGQSTITAQFLPTLQHAQYYLAIAHKGIRPLASSGPIWLEEPATVERPPDGPGASDPLVSWLSAPTVENRYKIQLTGACFVAGGCYANCDQSSGNPLLTANDFQCFILRYAMGDTYANCDGSYGTPALTPNDFQCFLNKYMSGCQ